ncbi:terpene synthase family protein [Actinomadura logoneensis]|uniref:terpene synthase family protein n=1 Tax=Actinomadura logoneensis TaxID=2293572 RepID=UPI0018F21C44|nr:terpene synthase family protein [Actinomadura logoneensis]
MTITSVERVVDVSTLLSLTDRVASLAAPSTMHPGAWPLAGRQDAWSRAHGLVVGDPDTSPLGRARCDRLAARLLPSADLDRVELLGQWLTWTFALDDMLDRPPLATSATAVCELYDDLLRAVRRGGPRPGARPLESTLGDLWQRTSAGMSAGWRRRFLAHLAAHRTACAGEAVNRRTGQVPAPERYPAARRAACGPHLFDLVEPALGVELPALVVDLPAWTALTEATADLLAWCNDLASCRRERADGDVHDLVAVLAAADGCGQEQAVRRAVDQIARRAADVPAAALALADGLDRLAASPAERTSVRRVAAVLLAAPRAHLDWLVESGRYDLARPGGDAAPRRQIGLRDLLTPR